LIKADPIQPVDSGSLREASIAKLTGINFYYQRTRPHLVRSVTREAIIFVLPHPHKDKSFQEL